ARRWAEAASDLSAAGEDAGREPRRLGLPQGCGDHAGRSGLPAPRRRQLRIPADLTAMLSRRLLLGAAGAIACPALAVAQGRGPDGWPNGRSVSLVLPFTPGGGTDV
ncbi:MAG: hypothetical protein ACK559_09925, partial [bacterium]